MIGVARRLIQPSFDRLPAGQYESLPAGTSAEIYRVVAAVEYAVQPAVIRRVNEVVLEAFAADEAVLGIARALYFHRIGWRYGIDAVGQPDRQCHRD